MARTVLRDFLIFQIILTSFSFCFANLEIAYQWKYFEYDWRNDVARAASICAGIYNHSTIITTDVQPVPDGRVFVSTPRFHNNPASLSTISKKSGYGGPLLSPYPNWSWHLANDCSGITSAIRTQLDDCGRLWLVDSGKIGNEQVCPAKILGFDLKTNKLVKKIEIPDNVSHRSSDPTKGLLELLLIESSRKDSCQNIWFYISDIDGYALVISDGKDVWRVENKIFEPLSEGSEINEGEIVTAEGETIFRRRGPESFVLFPPGYLPERYMLFKSLSNYTRTFAVKMSDLHNSKNADSLVSYYGNTGVTVQHEPSKVVSQISGTLFASYVEGQVFGCWNLKYPLASPYVTFLSTENKDLTYVTSIKTVVDESDGVEYLWVTSNRAVKYYSGTMDFDQYNFKVLVASSKELIARTYCQTRKHTMANGIEEKNFVFLERS